MYTQKKRERVLNIRLSEDEYTILKEDAAAVEMKMSSYIRWMLHLEQEDKPANSKLDLI